MRSRGFKILGIGVLLSVLAFILGRRSSSRTPGAGEKVVGAKPQLQKIKTRATFVPPSWRGIITACATAACITLGLFGWSAKQRSETRAIARALTAGDPTHAPDLLIRYGCAGCHTIPGVPGGDGKVGPSLASLRERVYVGGVARNSPDNLVRWIVNPQSLSPRSAMPASGITDTEARDVAAYLYMQ